METVDNNTYKNTNKKGITNLPSQNYEANSVKITLLSAINLIRRIKDKSEYHKAIYKLSCDFMLYEIWSKADSDIKYYKYETAIEKLKYVGKCCNLLFDLINDKTIDYNNVDESRIDEIQSMMTIYYKNYTDNINK